MSTRKGKSLSALFNAMRNKDYRDAMVESYIDTGIAFQIRANRDRRGWSQAELGERTGKRQATISECEDPEYGRHTLRTLKRIASAFDVALVVRFVPFSELAEWASRVPEMDLSAPSFAEDMATIQDASDRASLSTTISTDATSPAYMTSIVSDRTYQSQAALSPNITLFRFQHRINGSTSLADLARTFGTRTTRESMERVASR